jgi:hypothetical protein
LVGDSLGICPLILFATSIPCNLQRSDLYLNALCCGGQCDTGSGDSMKQVLASFLTTLMIVAMTLSAMVIIVRATVYVTSIESPLQRAGAIGAELLLGVILLLGTVWLATHLAVLIFAPRDNSPEGENLG